MSFSLVVKELKDVGVLKETKGITLLAALRGDDKNIKAGEYEFSPSMSAAGLLKILVEGKSKDYRVTIPEGYNVWDIARVLEEKGFIDAGGVEDFVEVVSLGNLDPTLDFLVDIDMGSGRKKTGLEGYLFPDTYSFSKGVSSEDVIRKMVSRFNEVFIAELKPHMEETELSLRELLILASIIEKETGVREEMPLISSVFHNRLRLGIRLQSDPTTIYGIMKERGFDGNLTRKDLKRTTPYNTYSFYGLPRGPIANPGKDALLAALRPAEADYIYFVSMNNGTHKFSKTLAEHNRAVRVYQKGG
jgi:UPF0755 protein